MAKIIDLIANFVNLTTISRVDQLGASNLKKLKIKPIGRVRIIRNLESLPKETRPKADPLPQTGASQESNDILAAIGGMLMAISAWGGAWLKRKQK